MKKILYITILIIVFTTSVPIISLGQDNFEKVTSIINKVTKDYLRKSIIQGLIYSLNEKPELAIQEFHEALLYEKSPVIYYLIGREYSRLGQEELADSNFNEVLKYSGVIEKDILLSIGSIYLQKQNYEKAREVFSEIIKRDSTDEQALYLYAIFCPKDENERLELINKVLKLNPESIHALQYLVDYYLETNKLEDAEKIINKLINIEPQEYSYKTKKLQILFEKEKYELARDYAYELLERYPEEPQITAQLAEIFYKLNKPDSLGIYLNYSLENFDKNDDFEKIKLIYSTFSFYAIEDSNTFNAVIKTYQNRSSNDTLALLFLYALYESKNDSINANNVLNKINIKNELNSSVLKEFISYLVLSSKYQPAVRLLVKLKTLLPKDISLDATLADCYIQLNDFKQAIEHLNFINKSQSHPNAIIVLNLAYCYRKLKQLDTASILLENVLVYDNENRDVISFLASIYDEMENFIKSDSLYEYALQLFPDDPILLNNYAYSLAKRKIYLEKALKMSRKSLEIDSLNDSFLDTLGWIYFQMGEYEQAKKYIQLAIDQGSPSAEILEHMGDIFMKLNNKEKAMEFYKRAIQLDPESDLLRQKLDRIK